MSRGAEVVYGPGAIPMKRIDGEIVLDLDLRAYRLSAIKKTAYRLAGESSAIVEPGDGDRARVRLIVGTRVTDEKANEVARAFLDELLDQELREQIGDETSALRTLIVAQAFSRVDLIKRD